MADGVGSGSGGPEGPRLGDGRLEGRQLFPSQREVGAHERRLTAQPLGDQPVRVGLSHEHQRPPEPLDVRAIPGLPGHQVLGNEAGLRRRARGDVGVRQLRLGAVHRGFEAAIDADLHQAHEGRDVIRDPGHEFLQRGSRGRPVLLRDRHVGGQLDHAESGFRGLLGDRPADQCDILTAPGILAEQLSHDVHALVDLVRSGVASRQP